MIIGVIGAGASGTLACAHLLNKINPTSKIVWISNQEIFGPGLPYTTQDPEHLLNVRVSGMSAFSDQPLHFYEWLKKNNSNATPDSFVPRSLYGEYLQQLIPDDNTQIEKKKGEVTSINKDARGKYTLVLKNGSEAIVDSVVLAIGILSNSWSVPKISADTSVLILGTGLSMVDLVMTYCRQNRTKPIHATSSRGLLPLTHEEYSTHIPSKEFISWLNGDKFSLNASFRLFRHECESAKNWRAVFDLIRPYNQKIWTHFSVTDRYRFLRHVARYWDIHRHRMSPQIAEKLQRYRDEGKFVLQKGRNLRTQSFDIVINCTGLGTTIKSPLFYSLVEKGFLQMDKPALGAHPVSAGVYALGPILRGAYWETVAIPDIRSQAESIAKQVVSN